MVLRKGDISEEQVESKWLHGVRKYQRVGVMQT